MPGAGVIDRDPGGAFQASAQHGIGLVGKGRDVIGQKTQHLTLGNHQPQALQQRRDPVNRHLTLVMLEQNEAHQLGTEMAAQASRQRRYDQLALRCQPAFPPIADHPGFNLQVLDHEVVIPLEPRPRWRVQAQLALFPRHR